MQACVGGLGGGDGGGGDGDAQLPGPQLEPKPAEAKAEVPAHAQRVSSLLASDKEFAPCRVERRAYAIRGERAWGDGSASGVHEDGLTRGYGGQGTRGAHEEHEVHGRDLGRVEVERLVERQRALPSRKAGMQCGKRCGPRA